jgi:hypothetical protein
MGRVDLANGRLEMTMVLLFRMWSKRFMVRVIGAAVLFGLLALVDWMAEDRDVLLLARGLENNKERTVMVWI